LFWIIATIEVKRIQPHQGDLLRALRLRALQDAPDAFLDNYDTASKQSIEHWQAIASKHATSHHAVNYLGFLNGELSGMVGAYITDSEPDVVNLCAMWVAPEARHQGVGTALVDRVVRWAQEAHVGKVRLWVNCENVDAVQFYDRCGFNDTGITTVFPATPNAVEKAMVYEFSGNQTKPTIY
jgi:ribosomal protein S18 acetylase RimI-like enzyme